MDVWLSIVTWLERGILVLLFGLSVWSIAIMIDRRRRFQKELSDSAVKDLQTRLLKSNGDSSVQDWAKNISGVHAGTLQIALENSKSISNANSIAGSNADSIDRAVRAYLTTQRLDFEKGFQVLASLGANAPFIGLFGTVLGIIRAFAALSGQTTSGAASVMSGISLALVATATGLFVAIPAVIAFNNFSSRLRTILAQCEALKDNYVATIAAQGRQK